MIRRMLGGVTVLESNSQNYMINLKGLTWNSEGFQDPGKHLFVKESIREYDLDFIALLETGRSNFIVPFCVI
jgi:hypothetical protein